MSSSVSVQADRAFQVNSETSLCARTRVAQQDVAWRPFFNKDVVDLRWSSIDGRHGGAVCAIAFSSNVFP